MPRGPGGSPRRRRASSTAASRQPWDSTSVPSAPVTPRRRSRRRRAARSGTGQLSSAKESAMPTHTETVTVIAGHELRSAIRGKMVPAFAALFSILAVGIALAGLGATGRIVVQGFTRTTVSLLTLALYLLPLLGAILGAAAFGDEDGATELLLAQPIGRGEALLGRAAGLYAALAGVAFAGFGAAGALVAATAGTVGLRGFALSALGATAVGCVGLGAGVLVGVLVRRRTSAVG